MHVNDELRALRKYFEMFHVYVVNYENRTIDFPALEELNRDYVYEDAEDFVDKYHDNHPTGEVAEEEEDS